MNMVDISRKRYTTKHYDKSKKIPADQIEALCTILQNSPSSVNTQPWHFVIVGSDAGRDKILPAIPDFNHPRVQDSSHTVVMCVRDNIDEAYMQHLVDQEDKDGRFQTAEDKQRQSEALHFFVNVKSPTPKDQYEWMCKQVYIALGNLLFAAAGMGIDSTAIEGFDSAKIDEILGLKEKGLKSVVVATLGYRAENDSNAKRPKSRLPQDEIFTFL
ncbi:oxygen-insensitive NAD(P)H nitroreductase [Orbaceae bacterium ESL0727]|nr:oxygen-insensitive NAD(P)H nitroreductase [Orbaceae bacterium ESL0727]